MPQGSGDSQKVEAGSGEYEGEPCISEAPSRTSYTRVLGIGRIVGASLLQAFHELTLESATEAARRQSEQPGDGNALILVNDY